jgi:adenosylhomocysteine nucleosidase/adenosylhomocysteine/aminodeoxyfutalosine nucleosidase
MIAISIANKDEWKATLNKFNQLEEDCASFPYGQYFILKINDKDVLFYNCGVRKALSAGACQYIIDHYDIEKLLIIGTCAGVDRNLSPLDIIIPNKVVQYDCTVREVEPLIKERFNVEFDLNNINIDVKTGTLGTADKPLIMWEDYEILVKNNIQIVDTEAAAIALICKTNNVDCLVVKGISDFPLKEITTQTQEAYSNQYNTFVINIPKIMDNIFDNYLDKLI